MALEVTTPRHYFVERFDGQGAGHGFEAAGGAGIVLRNGQHQHLGLQIVVQRVKKGRGQALNGIVKAGLVGPEGRSQVFWADGY